MSFVEDERGVPSEVAVLRGERVSRWWSRCDGVCVRRRGDGVEVCVTLTCTAKYSRMSMPSVMYLITVDGPVQSSNLIVYPTSCPKSQPNSSATRFATLIAATRRGCVQPIMPRLVRPISAMYCVI